MAVAVAIDEALPGAVATGQSVPAEGQIEGAGWAGRLVAALASPRWMLAFFAFAMVSALVSVERPDWITGLWVGPLAIFALSLVAAIATNPRFRHDAVLLGLHLGLLAFVVLVLLARLTYLDGAVTLSEGTPFDGRLQLDNRGLLHPGKIEHLHFANEGFVEDFAHGARWHATKNRVRWWDETGKSHVAEIGDDHPLLLGGYRLYTTRNRGYSPVFNWQPLGGEEELGSVQLRAGPWDQANGWQLPDGPEIWAMLQSQEEAHLQPGQQRRNLGAGTMDHSLVIRVGERREVLQLGEELDLPEGRLTYVALHSWMGYRVVYDWTMHWMAAAAVVVVGCMIAFYARLLSREDSRLAQEEGNE